MNEVLGTLIAGATPPTPHVIESLDDYLERVGIVHFTGREVRTLRRLGHIARPPSSELWPRIIPALALAEELREQMGCPLIVGNGYRPRALNRRVGGSRNSQHIHFRALDLDLPSEQAHRGREFQECAAALWLNHGEQLRMGLGFYYRRTRVHIDCGFRRRYWKRRYVKPILEGLR